MPADEEKAYVKKHKLNAMLNELYTAIVASKPEDPVEFSMRHFEAKMPEKPKTANTSTRRFLDQMNTSIANVSINEMVRSPANRSMSGAMVLNNLRSLVTL